MISREEPLPENPPGKTLFDWDCNCVCHFRERVQHFRACCTQKFLTPTLLAFYKELQGRDD